MSDKFKEVLYEPKWQALRVSLLSRNNAEGGFGSIAGTKSNLKRLDAYISAASGQEKHNRLWRVLNLLNAVRMGFSGQKAAGSDRDDAVVTFRNSVQKMYNESRKKFDVSPPGEDEVRKQLKGMSEEDRKKIRTDLVKRQKTSNYSKNRPELHKFVKTVEEYIDG